MAISERFLKQSAKKIAKKNKGKGAIGSYKEDTGGGEPIDHGKKVGRGAWKKGGKKEKRDEGQPRTEDGKFTYNAANGKELKDVSKDKNGNSRGYTVPPFLTGGENGVQYFKKQARYGIDKNGKKVITSYKKANDGEEVEGARKKLAEILKIKPEEVWGRGDKVAFKGNLGVAEKSMVESLQLYERSESEKKENKYKGEGSFEGDRPSSWRREEAKTAEEKAAVERAKEPGMSGKELLPQKAVEKETKEETIPSTERKEIQEKVEESPDANKVVSEVKKETPSNDVKEETATTILNKIKKSPNYDKHLAEAKRIYGDYSDSEEIILKYYAEDILSRIRGEQ